MPDHELVQIVHRFAAADCSWLATVTPQGRAHVAPVWHAWYQGHVYVVTTGKAVKVGNIQHNPSVAITHPDPMEVIILEGVASLVEGMKTALQPLFKAKYDWDIVTDEAYQVVIKIRPRKLIAWGKEGASYRRRWRGDALLELPG